MNDYIFIDDCPPDDFVERSIPCLEITHAMAPYLSRLEVKLLESGYTGSQIRRLTKTAAGLGRYLDWRGIGLADAGSAELEAYSVYCGWTRSGRRTEYNTGLSTIQAFLKPYGILSRPETPTAADPWLSAFEQHERSVRGLKDNTIASYRHFLLPFVLGLCKDGAPEWAALNGPSVSGFITTDLAIRRASRRTMIAGVRNFLRFLIFKGSIARGVLRAIPKIRSRRYSGLPEPLTTEEHELVLKACQSEAAGRFRCEVLSLGDLVGWRVHGDQPDESIQGTPLPWRCDPDGSTVVPPIPAGVSARVRASGRTRPVGGRQLYLAVGPGIRAEVEQALQTAFKANQQKLQD